MKAFFSVLTAIFALSLAAQAEEPVNAVCPVCGKDPRLIFHSKRPEGRVAFATKECKAKFDRTPSKYKVTKK